MLEDLLRIIFPSLCIHCGKPLVGTEKHLCTGCLSELGWTHQATYADNTAELRLAGRIPVEAAAALLYFHKGNVTQSIVHHIKYHGGTQLARQFGHLLGEELASSGRFGGVDLIVPVPLHWWRQMQRGYNQSRLLCEAMSEAMGVNVSVGNLYRKKYTSSQTTKNRLGRLDNMQGVFGVKHPEKFEGRHLLLVDDLLTTGATTEACYQALSSIKGLKISVATLAIAEN